MELLYVILLILCKNSEMLTVNKTLAVIQETGIRTAEVGETVTLRCSCKNDAVTYQLWYQQSLGGKPHLISKRIKHSTKAQISPAFEERFRVIARSEETVNDLIITDLLPSDSGMYYCVILIYSVVEFGQGVFLHVKTSPSNTLSSIHQPKLKLLRLGESVNLSCSVYAEPCAAEPNLYWFRHAELQPAVMYLSNRCCTSALNGTFHGKYCTSYLELHHVRSSDAGTYHCALASCGAIVFGEGTKVEIVVFPILVYCLSVALALSILALLVLSSLVYKIKLKLLSACKGVGTHQRFSASATAMQEHDAESLHYAAVSLKRSNGQQLQEDTDSACVYSRVRSRKE